MREKWCEKYQDYRAANKQITRDRECPEWFLDELGRLDPCLRVEWWNYRAGGEPSFRLVRVVDDGRWAHVRWFKLPSYSLLNSLRACDTHRANKMPRDIYNEEMERTKLEALEEERAREEWRGVKVDDVGCAVTRRGGKRLYSYLGAPNG